MSTSPALQVIEVKEEATLAFDAFGVRIAVSASDPGLLARVQEILPAGAQRCRRDSVQHRFRIHAKSDGRFELQFEENFLTGDATLDHALMMLDTELQETVALHAPHHIFVHAGAVAHNGRGLLVPGESFTGKSTMTAALLRAGATYCSDDFSPLDGDGLVHPYPKPISIRADDLSTTNHAAESLGAATSEGPLPVAAIILSRYVPGAEWRPRRLSPGEAVLAMFSNTVPAQDRPSEALASIRRAVEGAVVLQGDRGEAGPLAAQLLSGVLA